MPSRQAVRLKPDLQDELRVLRQVVAEGEALGVGGVGAEGALEKRAGGLDLLGEWAGGPDVIDAAFRIGGGIGEAFVLLGGGQVLIGVLIGGGEGVGPAGGLPPRILWR